MSKKIVFILAGLLAAVLLLAACERSAVAPESLATSTNNSPAGGQTLALPDAYKTQTAAGTVTALVLTMQPGGQVPTPTGPTPTVTATIEGGTTPLPPTNTPIPTTGGNPNAPTPTPGRPASYTLQNGEFPYCIARRFNVDPDELLSLNSLAGGEVLQPGLVLNIPQTGNTFPGTRALHPHPATYSVLVDDTIYKVACYYGDVDPIFLAASMELPPLISCKPGQS